MTMEQSMYAVPSFFHSSSSPTGFVFSPDEALHTLREAVVDTDVNMPALLLLNWVATTLPTAGCDPQLESWLHESCAILDTLPNAGYPQSVPFQYIKAVYEENKQSVESWGIVLKDATQRSGEIFGPAHPNTIVCQLYACWHDLSRAQDQKVLEALEQCSRMCQESDRDSRLLKVNCHVILGRALTEAGHTETARETYRQVLNEPLLQLTPLRMYRAMVLERLADLESEIRGLPDSVN